MLKQVMKKVQPSASLFKSPNIFVSITVGMSLFAVAQYEGVLQGNCRYVMDYWWRKNQSKGTSTSIPVIDPKK